MESVDYVICAAGEGKRFSSHGISTPKSQIQLLGKTFLERSLASLPLKNQDKVIVITQKSHRCEDPKKLIGKINSNIECDWIEIEGSTKGQLDTFLLAERYCRGDRAVAVWNCDTYFQSKSLSRAQEDKSLDGIVPCGNMAGEHWSFFKTDSNQILLEAVEKRRISDWASVGYYFFKDQKRIFDLAKKVLALAPPSGHTEYYVSFLYPYLVKEGAKIKICEVDEFRPFGTPEEVERVWGVSIEKLRRENS